MRSVSRRAAPITTTASILALAAACATAEVPEMPGGGVQPSPDIAPQADVWATTGIVFDAGLTDARFAVERAHDPVVREHARRVADYYGAAGPHFTELLRRHEIEARAAQAAERLRQAHAERAERLGRLHGPEFDGAWIDHQIVTNRGLIDEIDRTWMPAATGRPDLEAELRAMRRTLQQHLADAERIRAGGR